MVLDKEDDYQNFQYSFAGLPDLYELFMLDIAGSWDIPATIFFGRSPQGMNSTGEGERSNYYNKIESNQESDLRPQLDKLMPVMGKSAWGYIPDDLDFEFRSVETALQKDKAEQTWRSTEAIRGAFVDGIISQKVAQKELKSLGDEIGLFTNITDEDILKASNEVSSPYDNIENEDLGIDEVIEPFAMDSAFNEADHPRGADGKFTSGSSNGSDTQKKISDILGKEHTGVKGQEAIDLLMKEKSGHVKGAFKRKDIGDIDLIWGNDEIGLKHIIKRRKETNQPLGKLLSSLTEVIEKGDISQDYDGDFVIKNKGKKVIVKPKLYGNKLKFVMTAYYEK